MPNLANNPIYTRMLEQTRSDLRVVVNEIEQLHGLKANLESTVTTLTAIVGGEKSAPAGSEPVEADEQVYASYSQPIWKSLVQALNGHRESFNVREAIEALERVGHRVESPNRFQIVRTALVKKPDVFEMVDSGLFRLKTDTKKNR